MPSDTPSQKKLVDRYLDWSLVDQRLARYPAIAAHIDETDLRKCSGAPPYYCHPLAWRLGTWPTESLIQHFDGLLQHGASLNGWCHEAHLLKRCNYDEFWGLIWQLQVARMFSILGTTVQWMKRGPDLLIVAEGSEFFVECYTYRKSFGIEEYIRELVGHVHPRLTVDHDLCLSFSLPKNRQTEGFLNELLEPLLDDEYVRARAAEAEQAYPVFLPIPSGYDVERFYMFFEGTNPEHLQPSRRLNAAGDAGQYLKVAIQEVVGNKRESNKLKDHRPNLLAVNCLLGPDFQIAAGRQIGLKKTLPPADFGSALDALLVASYGIDAHAHLRNCLWWVAESALRVDHPAIRLLRQWS